MVQYLVTGLLYASLCSHIDSLIPPPPPRTTKPSKKSNRFFFYTFLIKSAQSRLFKPLCALFLYIRIANISAKRGFV